MDLGRRGHEGPAGLHRCRRVLRHEFQREHVVPGQVTSKVFGNRVVGTTSALSAGPVTTGWQGPSAQRKGHVLLDCFHFHDELLGPSDGLGQGLLAVFQRFTPGAHRASKCCRVHVEQFHASNVSPNGYIKNCEPWSIGLAAPPDLHFRQ